MVIFGLTRSTGNRLFLVLPQWSFFEILVAQGRCVPSFFFDLCCLSWIILGFDNLGTLA